MADLLSLASGTPGLVVGVLAAVAATVYMVWGSQPKRRSDGRKAVIAAIATAVPQNKGGAAEFMSVAKQVGYTPESLDLMEKIAVRSGISNRHTVLSLEKFGEQVATERPVLWEREAPVLALRAARSALAGWKHGSAADITHVIVHSCTGFSAPGIDFALIEGLGLRKDTRKLGVNFMGCFGGFTTMYVAKQIIEADPTGTACVLVVCVELCSIHINNDPRVELIIGNTIFADGAAASIYTHGGFTGAGKAPMSAGEAAAQWAIGDMASDIIGESAHCMTWKTSPGVPGQYDMWLDKDIPSKLSGLFIKSGLAMVRKVGIASPWACAWGIHPGGKAIIKAFRTAFGALRIAPDGLDASEEVLRDYGNMSSATIFFVLERVLARTARNSVFIAGFGPGLTIEFGCLYRGGAAALAAHADPLAEPATGAAATAPVSSGPSDATADAAGVAAVPVVPILAATA